VHSVSPAVELEKDFEAVANAAADMMRGRRGSFKVLARRSDKKFPIDSMAMQAEIGGRVLAANPNLTVDVHKPEIELSVEIRDFAYLYTEKRMAAGGMPMGTGGKALLLLSGGIDSPVAGYMMMKRGVSLDAAHFYSFPYTGERARQKVLDLAKILGEYGGGVRVHVVPFTDIQLQIHEKCPADYGTLIMRRAMMRISENLAGKVRAQALITGESLGQVASQTLDNLAVIEEAVGLPILRPLIGSDKEEIVQQARRLGSYEISIRPDQDCCRFFVPRHPATCSSLEEVRAAEAAFDVDGLVRRGLEAAEILDLAFPGAGGTPPERGEPEPEHSRKDAAWNS